MSPSASTFASDSNAAVPRTAPAAARAVIRLLGRLRVGRLDLQLPDGGMVRFGNADAEGPHAAIRLTNWNACVASLGSGDIGFAADNIAGD